MSLRSCGVQYFKHLLHENMSEDLKLALALSALGLLLVQQTKQRQRRKVIKRNRTKWVKSWLLERQAQGSVASVCRELDLSETPDVKDLTRLFPAQFETLKELIKPLIQRQNTNYRDCISVEERLTVTLRFLETGENPKVIAHHFHMGLSTVRGFIPETCAAIIQVLKQKYLKCPDTAEEWQQVADGFQARWNFPNCLGALDGKHINMRPPPGSGAQMYSVKHPFSMVLMGLVDSMYRFLYVDLGRNGQVSDSGVFAGCSLHEALERRTSNIPAPATLPDSDQLAPYCIVAPEAFPLQENLMTPYPNHKLTEEQRIYNYRLSRARSVAENAFGLIANRFRVLLSTISFRDLAKMECIVLACCALHNFLQTENTDLYTAGIVDQEGPDQEIVLGTWREDPDLRQGSLPHTTDTTLQAKQHRDGLCSYFNSAVGAAPFQWDKI